MHRPPTRIDCKLEDVAAEYTAAVQAQQAAAQQQATAQPSPAPLTTRQRLGIDPNY